MYPVVKIIVAEIICLLEIAMNSNTTENKSERGKCQNKVKIVSCFHH